MGTATSVDNAYLLWCRGLISLVRGGLGTVTTRITRYSMYLFQSETNHTDSL